VYEFYQPSGQPGVTRYAVTTMGITALFFGIHAFRLRSRRMFSWLLPFLGVLLGSIATIATIASLSYFFANPSAFSGDLLPGAAHIAPSTPLTTADPVASEPAAGDTAPERVAPVGVAPTRAHIAQTLGTLAFALKQTRTADQLWPLTLGQTSNGGVFNPFSDHPDQILVTLPQGTTLQYQTSSDRTSYAMRLSSVADPTIAAEYSSSQGVVTNE
jgi:hypothetical protein